MPKVEQLQQPAEQQQQQQRCDYDYDDFTYIPNMVFKTMGYDFLSGSKPLWQHLLLSAYFGLCFISNCYISYYMILRILQWDTLSDNPKLIMRYAIMVFFMLNSDVKFFAFLANRRRMRLLNLALRRLYPSEQRERLDYQVNKYFWSKFTRYALYLYYFVVLLVVLGPISQSTVSYLIQRHKLGNDARFLFIRAFPMEFGFSTKTPIGYAIALIVESTFTHLIMNVNLGTDLWLVCLSTQISMHFDHVAKKLHQYNPGSGNERENNRFVIDLVNQHQLILSLHKELNHIFGMLLAYNLFSTASTLCCVALYTIVQGLNREGFSFLLFFFTTAAQFYMVCHSGQILIDSSKSIATAGYMQNWHDSETSYKKCLLLILVRAQEPAELSARGIIIISLDTFKILINITFRFFAVVRTVLGK
ncbi:odorant receptor 49a [Drosophila tropicalis]|uniref:odorant receptor 49a n=1 Tax=Drosophila tropicalis TaxID=46794 RepID=UPI0035ABEB48